MADNDLMVDGKPLSSLRVVDLKQELEKRGMSKSGTKKDLADRLKTRLELELLQHQQETHKVQEESPHVPNLSLTQELDDKNDFVKSYLAQQQKSYEENIEVHNQVMPQSTPQEEQPTPSEAPVLATAEVPETTAETRSSEPTTVEPEAMKSDIPATTEASESVVSPPSTQETPVPEEAKEEPPKGDDIKSSSEPAEPVDPVTVPECIPEAAPASVATPVEVGGEKVDLEGTKDGGEKSTKEVDDSTDTSSLNQVESKGEEDIRKNDVSSSSQADDSLTDSSTSKTRPKRKWTSSRTERPQRQGITTSELNNLLPSKEKVSRIVSQDDTSVGETTGTDESVTIASSSSGGIVKASSETATFSGKSSGSCVDDGNDSSVLVTTPEGKPVTESEKSATDATVTTSASKVSKGSSSPSTVQVSEEMMDKVQTPPRNAVSCYLFICNLTRPFTLKALQTLLSKFGTISSDNFWIDKIKSKCIVEYDTEEHSTEARKELHGLRWPDSNPKTLAVDFSSLDELNQYKLSEQENILTTVTGKASSQEAPVERNVDSKTRSVDKYDVVLRSTNEDTNENETTKRQVREWDRDKVADQVSPKRSRRSPHDKERAVEEKKVEKEAPGRLLDDLFRKTRALPVLYWLPLSEEEAEKRIKVREEREKKRRQEYEAREERLREMRERRNQSPRGRKNRSPPVRGAGARGDQSERRRSPRRNSRSRSRSRSPLRRSQGARRRSRSPGRRWSPRRK